MLMNHFMCVFLYGDASGGGRVLEGEDVPGGIEDMTTGYVCKFYFKHLGIQTYDIAWNTFLVFSKTTFSVQHGKCLNVE